MNNLDRCNLATLHNVASGLSKKFHVCVEWGINRGTTMTITVYLAATALAALILWVVLGLLIQES